MTTGERIKQARKLAGLTQSELADKIGVKYSAIHKYESGMIVNLKRETIDALSKALDVRPSWLMCIDDEQPADIPDGLSEEETAMLDLFSRLSPGARENTLQALRILGSLQEADQRAVSDLVLAVLQTKGLL